MHWKTDHVGIIHQNSTGDFLVGHALPEKGYSQDLISHSKPLFTSRYRINLAGLIKTEITDEKAKHLHAIFTKSMGNVCREEFLGVRFTVQSIFGLLFKHRGKKTVNFDQLTVEDLRKSLSYDMGTKKAGACCSELAAFGIILALQKVKQECEKEGIDMEFPFDSHEILSNLDPNRLFNILNKKSLLIRVESNFEKLFSI